LRLGFLSISTWRVLALDLRWFAGAVRVRIPLCFGSEGQGFTFLHASLSLAKRRLVRAHHHFDPAVSTPSLSPFISVADVLQLLRFRRRHLQHGDALPPLLLEAHVKQAAVIMSYHPMTTAATAAIDSATLAAVSILESDVQPAHCCSSVHIEPFVRRILFPSHCQTDAMSVGGRVT